MKEKVSRMIAYILRHNPYKFNIKLCSKGWTSVDSLIKVLNKKFDGISLKYIETLVKTDEKQRYSLVDGLIRANQGHSIKGITAYDTTPKKPPNELYHGTAYQFIGSIKKNGLIPMNRHHVHLSRDVDTAEEVAARNSLTPVVLKIDALKMHKDMHIFYVSDNNVWLTSIIPWIYITIL